jgi:D-beta-D-heptose 7-phosphate kinase/D-beta-D-heptose 1-phosphate adenosyltransferase
MPYSFLGSLTQDHKKKCLVVGDVVLDSYIFGGITRISSEAPIPVIEVGKTTNNIGGAGNVIKNLRSFGFDVSVVSIVGNDQAGEKIMHELSNIGVEMRIRVSTKKITSKKTRIISSGAQVARFDHETKTYEDEDFMKILYNDYLSALKDCDIVVISDYERGVLEENFTKFIIKTANDLNKPIICDPRVKDFSKYSGCTIITPNVREVSNSIASISDESSIKNVLDILKHKYLIKRPVITLSEKGIAGIDESGEFFICPAFGGNVVDVTGAGDTVVASFAFAIANNLTLKDSCLFANMAASMVVDKIGTHTTNLEEIKYKFTNLVNPKKQYNHYLDKIITKEVLANIINQNSQKTFVFTNGCFDILHTGHLDVISRAKACGDYLILGLNSDSSVSRLKGPTRPINNQQTRSSVLAAIEFIDFVVIFDEDTPESLIKFLRPQVLAKGIDYQANPQDLPGAKYVKRVEILGEKKDSTTSIINKIISKNF